MTNFERHKEQILNLIQRSGRLPSKLDGKLTSCGEVGLCRDCDFNDDNDSCGAMFAKWLYEDDGEECSSDASKPKSTKGGCEGCHYQGNHILNLPCCHCERAIIDCFEPKKKTKTRRDEFLEHYPNANVLGIQPCSIEEKNFGEYCGKYDRCSECVDDYWSQEVE